jgi:hypothetical protein
MAKADIETVLGRVLTDSEFRELLSSNPSEALAEYDLTDEEKDALSNVDSSEFNTLSQKLDERLTKGWSNID